jgi:hypothetical protein
MPEITFTIDPATGALELHVSGVAGPACDDVAKLARELLGEPAREQTTSEYYLRPRVRPQVRSRGGR